MQTFLHTDSHGSFSEVGHPGWMSGDDGPERLLTADELVDIGFGLLVVDAPPVYNPATQRLSLNPVSDWPKDARSTTKTYTVTDLTAEEIRAALPPLSPRQLCMMLPVVGLSEADIEGLIDAIPDATDRARSSVEWRKATSFSRNHPLVVSLSAELNFEPAELDTIWLYASGI
ncbi:hypothetical protein [Mesorhizobium loti]|jgi:hypothetical protein|nr:hypothetical protein [Mesorhizobium loti]